MKYYEKTKLVIIVFLINYLLDRLTKLLATKYLTPGKEFTYIVNLIKITYVENKGAFLGTGSNLPEFLKLLFLIIIPLLFIILGIYYCIFKEEDKLAIVFLTMIIAGGVANIQDRIFNNGKVIDFLNFGIGESFRTGILNFADMSITFGAILFIINEIRKPKSNKVD